MSYLYTIDWKKIRADVEKGLRQGVVAVKRGSLVVKRKAEELGEEGKRQYRLIALKTKMHQGITDLGARVYSLLAAKSKNPALDATVKDIAAQIKSYEAEMALLEKKPKKTAKRRIKKAA